MRVPRFHDHDFDEGLPAAGTYRATIHAARLRRSARGNPMLEVVHELEELPGHRRVTDYFVLEGASERGVAVARHRLVELYRACGLDPHGGDEIQPEELVGGVLHVRLGHQERDGQQHLRVLGYRPVSAHPHGVPF
jgi:hypothetical protein